MAPASSVKRRLLPLATLLVAAVLNPVGSFANPTGANVTGGAATVSGQGTARVTIDQSSDRAFIEWNSFSVAKGESVRFNQPSASSVTANKVVGVAPSDILGAVSANGRIILINPNGIFFGRGSTVDAAGLIATTLDLDKDSFLAGGKLKFSSASDISASVVNEGTLTLSDAGLGALVAPHVRNSGALVANLGTAVLASGKAFTVDFTGDGLITFALGEGIASTLVGADGQPLKAQVEQAGEVAAGRIVLSAAAAREVVNQSVNVSGLVRAGSAGRNADGSISLRGSNSVAVAAGAEVSGTKVSVDADSVAIAGNLSASSIQLTGEHVAVLAGATLSSDGGSILVGGDWQGSNGVRQAITTTLEAGATIDAGQGGKVVLWSDVTNADSVTTVAGLVRALGGRIETSGHLLELPGVVQAGIGGSWLLDPTNVTITTTSTTGTLAGDLLNAGVTNIKATDIQTAVNAGSTVTILATGTFTLSTPLAFAPATGVTGTLTLNNLAGTMGTTSNVTLSGSGGVSNSGAGVVNLSIFSNGIIYVQAPIVSTNGPINVALQSANQTTNNTGVVANITVSSNITTRGGYLVIDATGGTINGLGTSAPTITRGADLATSGKGGGITINAAINTTTTGAVASATTTGGNFVIADSGQFSLQTQSLGLADIGGSATLSLKGGNQSNTNGAYGWLLGTGTGYFKSTGSILIDGRTPFAVNTTLWVQGPPITSFAGSITMYSSAAGSVGGYGQMAIQGPISAYGPITIQALGVGNVLNTTNPTLTSTAAGTITSTTGLVSITVTGQNSGVYATSLAGLITAPQVAINATNATAGGLGVSMVGSTSGVTITADAGTVYPTAGNALSITSTVGTAGVTGGITVTGGNIINQSNGGSVSFVTNGDLTATSAVNFSRANTSSGAQTITYDTRSGNLTSQITTGPFTYNATGATQKVNYVEQSNGSNLSIGNSAASTIALSGYILVDNTNSGLLTADSAIAGMTTSAGVTALGALSAGDYIFLNGLNNSATLNAVNLGAATLTVTSASTASAAITVIGKHNTANIGNPGIASTGAVAIQSSGGSMLFQSNGAISQTGAVTLAANSSGVASSVTYDTTTGNKNAGITSGALTLTGGAAASNTAINYTQKSAGAALTIGTVSMPGYILLDNTYGGTAGAGGTPTSGYINQTNASTLATTASNGITVTGSLGSGPYAGSAAITLNGVSNLASYWGVNLNGNPSAHTASAGNIAITGTNLLYGGVNIVSQISAPSGNVSITGAGGAATAVYAQAAASISAKSVTFIGTGTVTTILDIRSPITLLAGGGDLTVTATGSSAGSLLGINALGTITDNAVGSNITFKSNNSIYQTGATSLVANTGSTAASVTYDTTTGNRDSAITSGALTLTGTSTAAINYIEKASGAAISVGAIAVPGYVLLDNTYGGTAGAGGTPTSGYINQTNAATLATTTTSTAGVTVAGVVSSGAYAGTSAITINGVSAAAAYGSSLKSGSLAASTGDINITGINPVYGGVTSSVAMTATTGNVSVLGIAGGLIGDGFYMPTGASITAGAGISISGTLTNTTAGAFGVRLYGSPSNPAGAYAPSAVMSLIAGGAISINAYVFNTSVNASYGIYTGVNGIVYLKSGGDTTISASSPNAGAGNVGAQLYQLATNVGGNFVVQGATTASVTNSSGAVIPNVARPSVGTAVTGGAGGVYIQNGPTITDGAATYVGMNALGNISITGSATTGHGITAVSSPALTSKNGNITLTGTSTAGLYGINNQSAAITANSGNVSLIGSSNTSYSVSSLAGSTISAKSVTVTGTETATATVNIVQIAGPITIVAGGGDVTVTGNGKVAGGLTGISATGAITDNAAGSSISFISNNAISQTGAISLVGNTSGAAASVTFDTTTGNASSVISTTGALTVTGSSTAGINYIQKSAGAALAVGTLSMPGYILLDNTYGGTAGAGGTPTSGYIKLSNASTNAQATLDGVLVSGALSAGAYAGANAITINAVSGSLPPGKNNITLSGALTATTGDINLTGETLANYGVKFAANVTATNGSINAIGVSGANAGAGSGLYLNGNIQVVASANVTLAGSVTSTTVLGPGIEMFASGNVIRAGNNLKIDAFSANASANTMYALRMGVSSVYLTSGGDLTISASNSAATTALSAGIIAYGLVTNAGGALTMQGSTLGARTNATGTSVANVALAAPSTTVAGGAGMGIILNGSASYTDGAKVYTGINAVGNISMTGTGVAGGIDDRSIPLTSTTGSITMTGVTSGATAIGVYLSSANVTASGGTYTAGTSQSSDAIRITGTALSGQSAINIVGTTAITNNSTNGNTDLIANVGNFVDPVTITNGASAGAIEVSAIGSTAAIISAAGTVFTQNANSGIVLATSNGGNLTVPKIANNGTGSVILAAGAYLPVGTGTGGQIVGVSTNTLTSATGNVYLFAGQPGTSFTNTTTLAYLNSALGTLSFNNTVFSQAYHTGNVAATSLVDTAINLANLPSANTKTGSTAGPAIQFRLSPSYQMVLSAHLTKVYGTSDPANTINSVATAGTLENQLAASFSTPATNPTGLRNNAGTTEIILNVNGTNFYLPLTNFLNSVTGTRTGYGVLAGEQAYVVPTSGVDAKYTYSFNSTMGILLTSGVTVSGVAGTVPTSLAITKAPLTVTSYGTNFTYDGVTKYASLVTASGLVTSVDGVSTGDAVTGATSTFRTGATVGSGTVITNPSTTVVNAGTYNGSPSAAVGSGLANYNVSYVGAAFTVAPAPLTIANNAAAATTYDGSSTYGGLFSVAGYTVTGLVASESIASVAQNYKSGAVVGSGTSLTSSSVAQAGVFNVTPSAAVAGAGTLLSNYTITYAGRAYTVDQIVLNNLNLTGTNHSLVYNGGTQNNYGATVVGLLGSDAVTVGGYASGKNVGTYTDSLTLTAVGSTNLGNYNLITAQGVLTITAAPLTIVGASTSAVYNAALRTNAAATVTGLLGSDSLTVTGAATGTHVGSYADALSPVAGSGTSLANYAITTTQGALTVTAAPLTVTATAVSATYGTAQALDGSAGFTTSGLQGGDSVASVTLTYSGGSNVPATTAAGTYASSVLPSAAVAGAGTALSDYSLSYAAGSTVVARRAITLTEAAQSLVYNASTQSGSFTTNLGTVTGSTVATGLNGDILTVSGVASGRNAGTYTPNLAISGTASANYILTASNGTLTITPFQFFFGPNGGVGPRIVGAANDKVYNATTAATGSVSVLGLLGSDTLTATASSAVFDTKNVGSGKAVTLAGIALAGDATTLANYTLGGTTSVATTAAVTPAPLTITGANTSLVYNASTQNNAAATVAGLVGGETVTLSGYGAGRNVGNYADTLTVTAGAGTSLSNYTVTKTNGALTITPFQFFFGPNGGVGPRIVGAANDKVYDAGTAATGSVNVLGLLGSDTLTATATAAAFDSKNVASGKTVTFGGVAVQGDATTLANYTLGGATSVTTTAAITPATLTVNARTDVKVYDRTTASSKTPTVTGLLGSDTLTGLTQAFADRNVLGAGASTLTVPNGYVLSDGNSGANYTLTVNTAAGTITPRPLSATGITAQNKVYDATTTASLSTTSVQVTGVLAADVASINVVIGANVTGTFADANVGTGKAVNLAGISLTGLGSANYTTDGIGGVSANITPAPLTIVGATTSSVYTAATQTNSAATITGLQGSDAITASGRGTGTNVGTYADSLVAVAGGSTSLGNYSITLTNGSLTVTPKALTAVAAANDKVYDAGTATTGSVTLTGLIGADAGTVVAQGSYAFAQSNIGTGLPVAVTGLTLTGAASGNYSLPGSTLSASAAITPAPLNVYANSDGKFYSQTDIVGNAGAAAGYNGYAVTGFVGGQTVAVLNSSLTAAGQGISVSRTGIANPAVLGANNREQAGTYAGALVANGPAASGNYSLNYVAGDFSIAGPGSALIRLVGSSTIPYGTAPSTLPVTVSYLSGGSSITSLTLSSATVAGSTISYVFADVLNNTISFDVSAASLPRSTSNNVKVGSYALTSLIGNVDTSHAPSLNGTAVTTAGSYTVTPAAATLTATAATSVYNGTTQTQAATLTGVFNGDLVAYAGTASGRNVGTYASNLVVSSDPTTSADVGNYVVTLVNNNLVITPFQLVPGGTPSSSNPGITAAANSRVYDGTTAATGTITPVLFAGDTLTATADAGAFANKHVGTAKTVTFGGISLVGDAATLANYSLPANLTLTAPADITPAALTVTGLSASNRVYNGTLVAALDTSGATVSGVFAGDTITVAASGVTGLFADKNVANGIAVTAPSVGSALVAGGSTSLSDYTVNTVTGLSANITQASLTITGVTGVNRAYDGTTTGTVNSANAQLVGVVAGDSITLLTSGAVGVFADKNVANGIALAVSGNTLSAAGGTLLSNYTLSQPTGLTANITKAAVTVTGALTSVVYNAATQNNGAATVSGLATGESLVVTGLSSGRNVGTYADALSATAGASTSLGNYTVTYVNGALTITPFQFFFGPNGGVGPRIVGAANDKAYNALTAATGSLSVLGLLGSDTLTATAGSAAFDTKNVGTGKTVTFGSIVVHGDATTLANYTLGGTTSVTTTAAVTPAPLTVTGANASLTYNAFTQTNAAATVTGLVGGETVTVSGYGAGRNVGTYADTLSVAAGSNTLLSNYTLTTVDGALTLTPYQLNFGPNGGVGPRVVGTANDKVYNTTTAATGSVNVLGLLGSDTLTATASSAAFDTKNVGTGKTVTFAGIALGGDATTLANYTLGSTTTVNTTAAVTPAALTITGVATSLVYSAATQTNATATVVGLLGGETVTVSGYGAGRNVGTYADALTVTAGTGTALSNYTITKTNGALTITPFQFFFGPNGGVGPRIVGAANDKVYDTFTLATGSVNVLGLLGTDVLTATSASSTFDTKNVGTGKTVTFGGIIVHGDATTLANYTLGGTTSVTTTAAITAAPLTITGANTSLVYNASTQTNNAATVTGLIGGETVTVSGYGAGRNVGSYADVLIATAGTGTDLNNYAVTTVNGALSVTPYQLHFGDLAIGPRVVGSATDKVYDTTTATTGTLDVLGLLGGDVLTASSAAPTFDSKNVGNRKTVTFSSLVLGGDATTLANYSLGGISNVTTTANVTRAPLAVVGATTSVVYDGTTQTNTVATVTGLLGSESVSVAGYGSGRNTGTYRDVLVTTAGAGTSLDNYFITTTNGALTVTPYQLDFGSGVTGPRIEATAQNKVYDTSVNANGTLTVTGLFAGDVLTATSATSTFATKDVGTGKTVTFGGVMIGGSAVTLSNYSLSTLPTVTALADVTPAPLKVTVQSDAKFVTQTDAVGGSGAASGYNGYLFSGFVGGETETVLASPVITVSRTGITNPAVLGASNVEQAGTYAGSLVASGPATASNYTLTYVPADFTVVPAGQLMVKTAGALSVYASGVLTPTITSVSYMTSSGGNQIEVLNQTVAGSSGNGYHYTFTDSAAGTVSFALVPVGTTNSHSGNTNVGTYALAVADFAKTTPNLTGTGADVVVAGQGIVTPKPVTLTASTQSTQYDATLKTQTYADNGLVANDLVTVSGLRTGTNAGGYRSQLATSGADAANYAFIYQDGLMAITPAPLTVTGANRSVVYNAASQANAVATVVGLIGSESVTVSGYSSARNVGVYADSLRLSAAAGTSLANYAVTYVDGALTVTPYPLSFGDSATGPRVKAAANNKVYDTVTTATGSLSVLGLLGTDVLTATAGAANFDTKNVGTGKTVTFSGILLGGDQTTLSNYDLGGITSVTTTAAVTKASVTVTGAHTSSVYNSFTQANTGATIVGLLGGETATVTGYGSGRNVGSYADHLALTAGAGMQLSNYDITYVNGGITLTPRALVLTNLSAVNKNYDGNTSAVVHGDLVGVLAGDTVTTGSILGTFADALAGQSKTVTVVSGSLLGTDAGNYILTPGQTTFADIIAQNKEIENFILGATKLGDVGIYKDWGLPQFRYPVPKTFIVRPVDAAAPTETTTGDSNAAGPAAKVRYFTGDEKNVDGTGFRYVYPKVNLGKAYYVGALRGDEATAAGGETTETAEAK